MTKEIDESLSGGDFTSESKGRVNVLLQQLNNKLYVLNDINREVLLLCKVDEIEREIEDAKAITVEALNYKRRIEEAL